MKININLSQLDSDGCKIDPAGIDFSRWKDNPIVTRNFDHSQPVAMAENIKMEHGSLTAELRLHPDMPKKDIERYTSLLAQAGVLIGKPGFQVIENDGNQITKIKLTEVSI